MVRKSTKIRTRFAPSPTGFMHIGGVRTALFGWLAAKQTDGQFILRLEDTDQNRHTEGADQHIYESLRWLGLDWDEGPETGGDFGPYVQSERLDLYKKYVQQLLDDGKAYVDTSTPEQVDAWRKAAQADKRPFLFREHRDEAKSAETWDGSKPVRLEIQNLQRVEWHDIVRGDLSAGPESLDDFIIMKADGYPTYNFAHVIDDELMKITHVIRGEEFISSTPKFIALYESLGFELPQFVTVPPILNQNGGKKLSKRDGAKDVLEYREQGYSVDGVLNFLASMGWNDGTEQEVFTKEELIEKFSLDRIQRSGAKFDEQRLDWLNGHHVRNTNLDDLYLQSNGWWPEAASSYDDTYKKNVLRLVHERLKYFAELPELTSFFFEEPSLSTDVLVNKKVDQAQASQFLNQAIERLHDCDFSEEELEKRLRQLVEDLDTKAGLLFKTIRGAVTGSQIAPGLFETLHVLGKDVSLRRMKQAVELL